MKIMAVSGKESRIVKISDKYYLITDYWSVEENNRDYYHAIGLDKCGETEYIYWKPKNNSYLIERSTMEVTESS